MEEPVVVVHELVRWGPDGAALPYVHETLVHAEPWDAIVAGFPKTKFPEAVVPLPGSPDLWDRVEA
jgi:hypothetical protein